MIPEYYENQVPELYGDIPVKVDNVSEFSRLILYIPMPHPVVGEIWDISAEIHATNNDLRARGYGLYLTTEVRFGTPSTHTRDGAEMIDASGAYNIGPEAHHGLVLRRGIVKWTQAMVDQVSSIETPWLKFLIWSGSSQAISSDRCDITPSRGHLRCLRYPIEV